MKFRTPRLEVKEESYLRETIKLCHPKMLFIIVCLTSIGHLLSPNPLNVERYLLGVAGVILGVLAAYRYNELADSTTASVIPRSHHKWAAPILLILAGSIAVFLSSKYGNWILLLAFVAIAFLVLYNLLEIPAIHNRAVYAFVWGYVPLVFSGMLQSLDPVPTPTMFIFGIWACFIAVSTLWHWGPTTCGRLQTCSKARGKPNNHRCHSPTLKCKDRVIMPREINNHMKVLIGLNDIQIFIITMAVAAWRPGA